MRSYKDARGVLWVSCSECTKEKSCLNKKINKSGCFSGTLLEKYRGKV